MAKEITPGSVQSDDNLRVWFVPEGTAVTAAALGTAESITYSLTPSGFNRSITEDTVSDERLTLSQVLQKRGRKTEELEVQYVFGAADDVAYPLLKEGVRGQIVARYSEPNATEPATGQTVDILHVECGAQRKDAPSANGIQTVTQNLRCVQPTEVDVDLAV